MSKTPEEIKKGLRRFATELDDIVVLCNVEEAAGLLEEARNRMFEAANYIEEMESDLCAWADVASSPGAVEDMARENYMLTERLAQVERERDAAVKSMRLVRLCENCKHVDKPCESYPCSSCSMDRERRKPNWEWRGVCEENTKEDSK